MRIATSLIVVCLALSAGAVFAQNVTILDQNNQPHEVNPNQFQIVGPHPGVIDVDHLHAQNGVFVRDINNQAINDPSPDPNGTGFLLANQQAANQATPPGEVISNGLFGPDTWSPMVSVRDVNPDEVPDMFFGRFGPVLPEELHAEADKSIHESSDGAPMGSGRSGLGPDVQPDPKPPRVPEQGMRRSR